VSYLELLGAMLVTWYFEVYAMKSKDPSDSMIAADALKLLTASVIFAVFVLNKRVRFLLLQKYLTMK